MPTREGWFKLLNEEQRIAKELALANNAAKTALREAEIHVFYRELLERNHKAIRTQISEEIERDILMRLINQFKVDE